jgi:U2-associated protein SR140
MTAEIFKKQILSVVEVWEDWLVFPLEFTQELRMRLEGGAEAGLPEQADMPLVAEDETTSKDITNASSRFKTSSFKPATEPEEEDGGVRGAGSGDTERVTTDDIDGELVDGEEIDGMPLDGDIAPREPLDGEPLDGEPLDGEPLDGEPLDGEPFNADPLETKLAELPQGDVRREGEDSDVPMEMDEDSD